MALFDEFVESIYEGVFEDPLWATFLARLQTETRSRYAGIFFRPPTFPKRSSVHVYSASGSADRLDELFLADMREDDPLKYQGLKEARTYRTADIPCDGPVEREFLERYRSQPGFRHGLVLRVAEPSGVVAVLSLSRSSQEFPKSAFTLLDALAPHLRRALRVYVQLERAQFSSRISADAMQRLNFGWIGLDANARILDIDLYAQQFIENGTAICELPGNRLGIINSECQQRVMGILARFARDPNTPPSAVRLRQDPWLEMLLVPSQQRSIMSSQFPVAIAYLHSDSRLATDRQRQISDLFGLLPSEARLALALGRGLSISEAATDLGISVATARSYSKQIYAKMGARGQADVIRFVLTSVLALT